MSHSDALLEGISKIKMSVRTAGIRAVKARTSWTGNTARKTVICNLSHFHKHQDYVNEVALVEKSKAVTCVSLFLQCPFNHSCNIN